MYAKWIVVYAFTLAWLANSLPLNINLGAYSPALVVGDGAISFEGAAEGGAGAGEEGVVETPGGEAPEAEPEAPVTEGAASASADASGGLESTGTSDIPVVEGEVSNIIPDSSTSLTADQV